MKNRGGNALNHRFSFRQNLLLEDWNDWAENSSRLQVIPFIGMPQLPLFLVTERDTFAHLSFSVTVSKKLFNLQSQLWSTTVFVVSSGLQGPTGLKCTFFSAQGLLSLHECRTTNHQHFVGIGSTLQISCDRPNMQQSKHTMYGFSSESFQFSG